MKGGAIAFIALAVPACATATLVHDQAKLHENLRPYQLFVRTGLGIPGSPYSPIAIVRDASVSVPPIISACGGLNIVEEPLTDGGTSFHFDVSKSGERSTAACLKKRVPGLEALTGGED